LSVYVRPIAANRWSRIRVMLGIADGALRSIKLTSENRPSIPSLPGRV
jgi:hypothetical protein